MHNTYDDLMFAKTSLFKRSGIKTPIIYSMSKVLHQIFTNILLFILSLFNLQTLHVISASEMKKISIHLLQVYHYRHCEFFEDYLSSSAWNLFNENLQIRFYKA